MKKIKDNLENKGLFDAGRSKKRKNVEGGQSDSKTAGSHKVGKENQGSSIAVTSKPSKRTKSNSNSALSPAAIVARMNLHDEAMKAKSDRIQRKKSAKD